MPKSEKDETFKFEPDLTQQQDEEVRPAGASTPQIRNKHRDWALTEEDEDWDY
jgi:hypothetical protein